VTDPITMSSHEEGTLIDVWVVPGASRTEIVGAHDGALRVRIAVAPEGGRANEGVAGLLAGKLGANGAYLESGRRSRRKQFVIVGMTPTEVERAIAALG